MRARNLDGHLGKTHGLTAGAPAAGQAWDAAWKGRDPGLLLLAGLLPVVSILLAVAAVALRLLVDRQVLLLPVTGLAAAGALLLLYRSRAGCARLALQGNALVLRHGLGLGRRQIYLPAAIDVGSLEEFRPDLTAGTQRLDSNPPGDYERIGAYLRFGDAITVACRKACSPSRHWDPAGWRPGRRRRRWHITLDGEAFIALQYALAARNLLQPRQPVS